MKKIFMFIIPIVLVTACVDSLHDYNVDQKKAKEARPAALFANALKGLTDILTTPHVASNNYRMFVQYWATTTYLDEPRYHMTARLYSQNLWNAVYRDALADLQEGRKLLDEDRFIDPVLKKNQLALIGIMEVYAWTVLLNTFGGVPYEQALNPENLLPQYDDAEPIFNKLLVRLDESLALLTPGAASFGSGDLIYSGDVAQWAKFGNSLKLKMGMTIADQNPNKARTIVEQAASSTTMLLESNNDNAKFPYVGAPPNNNPVSANLNPRFSSREDFVITSKIVNEMNLKNDPRMKFYFTTVDTIAYDQYEKGEPAKDAKPLDTLTVYVGGKYGFSNTYADFSHVGDKLIVPAFEGMLMEYSEIAFLLAEARERGFAVPGTAEDHYTNAVKASILYWGGKEADADAYLLQPSVAYATAGANYREKIGTQKWISLFNRGWESWVEWRRLDYPLLSPPSGEGITSALKIPVRMIYPVSEQTLNGGQWELAAGKLDGDSPDNKLFWDRP